MICRSIALPADPPDDKLAAPFWGGWHSCRRDAFLSREGIPSMLRALRSRRGMSHPRISDFTVDALECRRLLAGEVYSVTGYVIQDTGSGVLSTQLALGDRV